MDEERSDVRAFAGRVASPADGLEDDLVQSLARTLRAEVPRQWQLTKQRCKWKKAQRDVPLKPAHGLVADLLIALPVPPEESAEGDASSDPVGLFVDIDDLVCAPRLLQGPRVLDHDLRVDSQVFLSKRLFDQLAAAAVVVSLAREDARLGDELVVDLEDLALWKERPLVHQHCANEVGIEHGATVHGRKLVGDDITVLPVKPLQEPGKVPESLTHVAESSALGTGRKRA